MCYSSVSVTSRGHADAEIEAVFAKYDVDGDRILDAEEQMKMASDLEGQKVIKMAMNVYHQFQTNLTNCFAESMFCKHIFSPTVQIGNWRIKMGCFVLSIFNRVIINGHPTF